MMLGSTIPRSPKLRGVVAAAAFSAIMGLILTSGAASGADPAVPNDDTRVLDVHSSAITTNPEMLYVPITPCRIVDTRQAVGAFSAGQIRSYYVGGTFGFAPQGGTSGGCGIPTGAQAVAAVVTAVSPEHAGFVRAWPAGASEPGATLLNYAGDSIGIGGQVKLRSGAGTDMTLKNYGGPTQIVIDVNGYYTKQMHAYISTGGTVLDQSGRLLSAVNDSAGTYTLTWDRNLDTCSGVASSDISGHILSVYISGDISYVYVDDNAGNASNYWFNVLISC